MSSKSLKYYGCASKATFKQWDLLLFVAKAELENSDVFQLYYGLHNSFLDWKRGQDQKTGAYKLLPPPMIFESEPFDFFSKKDLNVLIKQGFISVFRKKNNWYLVMNRLSKKQIAKGYILERYMDSRRRLPFGFIIWLKAFETCWPLDSWDESMEFRDLDKAIKKLIYVRILAALKKGRHRTSKCLRKKRGTNLFWTREKLREFCDLWANEPDIKMIVNRFPNKDMLALKRKAREFNVVRLSGVVPDKLYKFNNGSIF